MRKHLPYFARVVAFVFYAVVFCTGHIFSQQLSRRFTVNDGLPSNLIYSMVQGKRGFLWVATDNGIARFDGKYFRVFTTNDGLPDNEILEVRKENDGTIWVNTFKQGPFYFDEKANRFIDPLKGVPLNKDFIKMILHVRTLEEGGIVFYSGENELVFKNKQLVNPGYKAAFSYNHDKAQSRASLYFRQSRAGKKLNNYIYYSNGAKIDSTLIYTSEIDDNYIVKFLHGKKLYLLTKRHGFFIASYDESRLKFTVDKIQINDELAWFRVTDNRINISSATGKVYVYDRKGLFKHYTITDDYFSNCILEDSEQNIWVGTLNKGLRLYKLNNIGVVQSGSNQEGDFLSIYAANDGKIYAGNYFGEIFEFSNGLKKIHRPFDTKKQIWIRALLASQNKIFALSEQGIIADFKRKIFFNDGLLQRMKDAAHLNDSIIIVGGVDPRGALFKLNVKTEKASALPCGLVRISKIKALGGRYIYCATNEGLFKYDYEKTQLVNDFSGSPLQDERILEIEITKEGLVVAATSTKGVFVLQNDKIIAQINREKLINNNITDILSSSPGIVWFTTRFGLSKVDYKLEGNRFRYGIQNFYMTEGLPANVLVGVAHRKDSLFIATEKGIAVLAENITVKDNPIKTFLTSVKVNHEPVLLTADNRYELEYSQRSVSLEFSGVDLGGHLRGLQYSFDTKEGWINLEGDVLNLELATGEHHLSVRSLDVNRGNAHPPTSIYFYVKSPFYVRIWFLILMAGLVAGLSVFVLSRIRSAKQKRELQNQLKIEQERNRITADLHDDIGSTLSSLQIYGDIASNVIDHDKEKAKAMLTHITSGASKISENIGDIIWSMKGNQAHALSLESRIKNIVSEILGPTDIDYEIHIDGSVDQKVSDISCRKNIILIVKEAVNNIVKYSNATKVDVQIVRSAGNFALRIKDNGVGMNVTEKQHSGNGLYNMKKRMEEINGNCDIISSPGNGTEIICRFAVTNDKGIGS